MPTKRKPVALKTHTFKEIYEEAQTRPPLTPEKQAEVDKLVAKLTAMGGFVTMRIPMKKKK